LQPCRPARTEVPGILARLVAQILFDILARTQGGGEVARVHGIAPHLVDSPVEAPPQEIFTPPLEIAREKLLAAFLFKTFRSSPVR